MALVEKYHVVAAVKPVATGQSIKEGQVVSLDAVGAVVIQGAVNKYPYGIAGDTKSTSTSYMPGIMNTAGTGTGWQNRVSDYFDETRSSSKMTVYHSGGEFATDQFSVNVASMTPVGTGTQYLYCRSGILDSIDQDGGTTVTMLVGKLTLPAAAYPSGVPGTDINGDIELAGESPAPAGTAYNNTYIEFKLLI